MDRNAEIRYLTDIRKCIREAIKRVWEDETVCPYIQERLILHQKLHHPSCSKDGNLEAVSKNAQKSPGREEELKICSICLRILPCRCNKKSIVTDDILKCAQLNKQGLKDFFSPKSCCRYCQKKRDYEIKVYKQVLQWIQHVPLDANCSCDDKIRRKAIIRELTNSLVEFRGIEGKQKEAIKKYLEILPMWQPIDQYDRDLFINKFVDNLMTRLKSLSTYDSNMEEIVSNWINEKLQNKMANNDDITKDQVLHTILDQIKSLKLDEISEKDKAKMILEKNIKDILKDIPLDQTSDVNFLENAAKSLAENISVTMLTDNSTIKRTSENDYNKTSINLNQENPKVSHKFHIVKQIPSSNVENLLQNDKLNKHTQTSDSIELIAGNEEEFPELQAIQEYIENKLLDTLEEIPSNIKANLKADLKNEILKIISKDIYKPSSSIHPHIKKEEYNSTNEIGTDTDLNTSVLLSELPSRREDIQDYVEKQVDSIFSQYGIKNHRQMELKNDLTNILTDQIMRGDDHESVKKAACSILREINISESQAEELCSTILQQVKNISLLQNTTPSVPETINSSYQKNRDISDQTEKEIIHFINEIIGDKDSVTKGNKISSIKILAKDIEKLILSQKYSTEDKENMITKKVFNFLKGEIFPTDEKLLIFAKTLAKKLLLIPLQTSTPKTINDKYIRSGMLSPTMSTYHRDNEYIHSGDEKRINKDDQPFGGETEKIYLDVITNEVKKWIERIPSDHKLSHDTHYKNILAKEIAKRIITPIANPSLNTDLVLKREIQQWLPNIVKEPNRADLEFLAEDVKETIKQKLRSQAITPPKTAGKQNNSSKDYKQAILDWLRKSKLFQNRDAQEMLMQESLASNLARDINNIILGNVSTNSTINTDEQMLKATQARMKQFAMDPKLKYDDEYNYVTSRQLLNSLKRLSTDIKNDESLEERYANSKLALITNEIFRWIENIPSNYRVSHDNHYHKMLAEEMAKKVLLRKSTDDTDYDLLLDRELLQLLNKIIKPSDEVDLQFIAKDLKGVIQRKLSSDGILLGKSSNKPNLLIEDLRENILDWLKNSQICQTDNTRQQEFLALNLAKELNDIIRASSSVDSGITKCDQIMKAIQKYVKQITTDSKLKDNDKNNYEMSLQLLNNLTKLPYSKVTDTPLKESDEKSKLGVISNEILRWIENIPPNCKVSQDKREHKVLAKEIAKKIMAPTSISTSKTDSVLEHELMQWLPCVVKQSNSADFQLLAEDLKKTVKQKVPSDILSIRQSPGIATLHTKDIKGIIIDWLKKIQRDPKNSIQEKLLRESLASNLARDLNNILSNKSAGNVDEQMMKAIQSRIKQISIDREPKREDKYISKMSLQLVNDLKKLRFDNGTDPSLLINESIKLGAISNEVIKWIENIPSYYKLSHDKDHLKMLAKEISKNVHKSTSNQRLTSDSFLEREIQQWLPKILKNINEPDLQLVADDLKEKIKQNLPTDVISIWKFSDNPNQFTENLKDIIMGWLQNMQMYKNRNSHEELLQKSLVLNLARDLNDIICTSSSTDSAVNKDEQMMNAIQTRIKQFTTDPKLKYNQLYNREVALELLKLLKCLPLDRGIEASLQKSDQNTELGLISSEVHKWIENIPSDYKISSDKHRHKIFAKEIAKRVLALTSSSNPNFESLLEYELLQWLPEIVKFSNEADLQYLANDLKETIQRKLQSNVTSAQESPDSPNYLTDTIKQNILDYLKNTQTYQTKNMPEKRLQESLVTELAKDLNDILSNKNYRDSNANNDELMLNAIKTYIKQFPMEPKLKYNDKHHDKMALEILKYINKLRPQKSSSLLKEKFKSTISKWLHNLPLTSTPDYSNISEKLCSLFSVVKEGNPVDQDTELYLKNELINVLQDLPLSENFHSYDKLRALADYLIKSIKYEQKNMGVLENPNQQTNHSDNESLLKDDAMGYDKVRVTENDDFNSTIEHGQSDNVNKEYYPQSNKVEYNQTNFADGTLVENEEIPQKHFETGEKTEFDKDQRENRKKVKEIKEKLTNGLMNILDTSNQNLNLGNGTVDENILKNDIETLIDTLSKNSDYRKFLLPLKQNIDNITKEVAEIKKKLLAEKDLKNVLHSVIDNTLPSTSHWLTKQRSSFEDLKEKLINAFINLNKASDVNAQQYKEDLKKEVNEFCHDYLQRFPATPVNRDQLCENLYTALQNVSFPKIKSVSSQFDRSNIEDVIGSFLNELTIKDTEKNRTLKKKFEKSLLNQLHELKTKDNSLLVNDKNFEQFIKENLKKFSFTSGETPNITDLTKDFIHRLDNRNAKKTDENIIRQLIPQYSDPQGLKSKTPQGLSPIARNMERLPTYVKHQPQVENKDDYQDINISAPTDITSEFEPSFHSSKTKLQQSKYKGMDRNETSDLPTPLKPIQNLDHQTLLKGNIKRSREYESTGHEVSPHVIIKEYHWDSRSSSQLDNLQPEGQIRQNQLRRTVPSLPIAESNIPFAPLEYPKQRINRNLFHRTHPQLPHQPRNSPIESPTMSHTINQEPNKTVPSQTNMVPSNIKHRLGHSCLKLIPTNVGKREPLTATTSDAKQQRRKFCNDQFTACSRSDLRGANATADDVHDNEMFSKYRSVLRNYIGNIPTNLDLEQASINEKRRKTHSCCKCFKHKSERIQDSDYIAIPNNLEFRRSPANLASCEKCRGTTCPHPSFFYFN